MIDYIETGNSDHKLLIWSCNLVKPLLIYKQLKTRRWNSLDTKLFMSKIAESPLSNSPTDVGLETSIELYNTTLTAILDNLIPLRKLRIRQSPSDPWFDKECRDSKCLKRKLERMYFRSQCQKELASWVLQKSLFKRLCKQKRNQLWDSKLSNSKNKSSITWSYINKISGRGKCNPVSGIEAGNFQKHLSDKIELVRKSLSDNRIP